MQVRVEARIRFDSIQICLWMWASRTASGHININKTSKCLSNVRSRHKESPSTYSRRQTNQTPVLMQRVYAARLLATGRNGAIRTTTFRRQNSPRWNPTQRRLRRSDAGRCYAHYDVKFFHVYVCHDRKKSSNFPLRMKICDRRLHTAQRLQEIGKNNKKHLSVLVSARSVHIRDLG